LEKDIRSGQHITMLPNDLAQSMLARLERCVFTWQYHGARISSLEAGQDQSAFPLVFSL